MTLGVVDLLEFVEVEIGEDAPIDLGGPFRAVLEGGRFNPSLRLACKVAQKSGVTVDELFSFAGES